VTLPFSKTKIAAQEGRHDLAFRSIDVPSRRIALGRRGESLGADGPGIPQVFSDRERDVGRRGLRRGSHLELSQTVFAGFRLSKTASLSKGQTPASFPLKTSRGQQIFGGRRNGWQPRVAAEGCSSRALGIVATAGVVAPPPSDLASSKLLCQAEIDVSSRGRMGGFTFAQDPEKKRSPK